MGASEADRFVLYQNGLSSSGSWTDHDGVMSPSSTPSIFCAQAFPEQDNSNTLPSLGEDFVGREVDMYRVMRSIARRRLVIVCASSSPKDHSVGYHPRGVGIGKSSIVLGVAHRLRQRRFGCCPPAQHYKDGIIFIRGASSVEDICAQWIEKLQKIHHPINNGDERRFTSYHRQPNMPPAVRVDQHTPLIVQLMRLARLAQNSLVIIDDCSAALTSPGSDASLRLHNFLCGLLQSLPKLRILMTALESPFIAVGNRDQQQNIQLNHSFKPLILRVCGLSNMASARLLLRRAHRRISLFEALDGNEDFETRRSINERAIQGSEKYSRSLVKALSRHPLIHKMGGHPCVIAKVALKITESLPNIGSLVISTEKHHGLGGADKTMQPV